MPSARRTPAATQMATKTLVSQEPQKVLVSQKESHPSVLDRNSCQTVDGFPPKRSSRAIVNKAPATVRIQLSLSKTSSSCGWKAPRGSRITLGSRQIGCRRLSLALRSLPGP
jgi:hypothetical protein